MNEEKKLSKSEEFEKADHIVLEVSDNCEETKEEVSSKKTNEKEPIKNEDTTNEKESVKNEDATDEKEPVKDKDTTNEKEPAEKKDATDEKDPVKDEEKKKKVKDTDTKAISQSKRLADVKKAEDDKKNKKESPNAKEKESGAKKKPLIVVGVLSLVVLFAVYFVCFWYFSSHFYKDVAINGTTVSYMDQAQANQILENFYKAYVLTLHTIDDEEVLINGKDISMEITLQEDVSGCFKKQKPYLWFIELFNHHDFEIPAKVAWNQEELDDLYENMDILISEDIVDPVDAYIGSDGEQFTIIEEVMGNRLDEDVFKQQVAASLQKIQAEINLKECDCYCKPLLYSDSEELKEQLETLGDYKNCVITLKLDDLELEPNLDMMDAVLETKGSTVTVSKTKVENYVKSLANKYDTVGTKRNFTTSFHNKQIQIEGKYVGYELDQEKTTDALYKALTDKKPAVVEAEFTKKGKTLLGENDIGDTYIEANLTEQKVIAYKDGKKIAESDCVSGNVSYGRGTCTGLYEIQGKQSPATLRGEKVPKTKMVTKVDPEGNPYQEAETTMEYSYESHVVYWMPFFGGYGLHDADGWRSSYGGDIYYYSGSHGCINLPRDFAKKLYENFDIGTPVLVYYEEDPTKASK